MSDRNLSEQLRALKQAHDALTADVRTLRKRAASKGAIRSEGYSSLPDAVAMTTNAQDTTLVEFKVDPGRWIVLGHATLRFEHDTFTDTYVGDETATVQIHAVPDSGLNDADQDAYRIDINAMAVQCTDNAAASAIVRYAFFPVVVFGVAESEDETMTLRLLAQAHDNNTGANHAGHWAHYRMLAIPA